MSTEMLRPHAARLGSTREAHVWSVEPDALGDRLAAGLSALSPDEHARMASFRFERDRIAYAAAHVLARAALSWCVPTVPPGGWDLAQTRNERPEVIAPKVSPPLRFSISHTHGLVACLVTREIDCGVDVERWRPLDDMETLAARVLSPAERSEVMALPDGLRPQRFFRYWTLKEAYVKARGKGLSLPLDAVCFDLTGPATVVALGTVLNDDGRDWQFEQWSPTTAHIAAVAIRSGAARDVQVVRHEGLPV